MRDNPSCLCLSSSDKRLPKEDFDHHNHQNGGFIRSVMEFVKPTCLWSEMKDKQRMQTNENQYQKLKMEKKGTLEELLLASPGKTDGCTCTTRTGGECKLFTRFFKRICPPFANDYAEIKASEAKVNGSTVSLERLLKVEVVDQSGETDVSSVSRSVTSMSRSQSGNIRKKVSFRVPSEADIIIFYASDADSED